MDLQKIVKFFATKKGVTLDVSIHYDSNLNQYYVDLKTNAKNHLFLYDDGTLRGRYDYETKIDFDEKNPKAFLVDICHEFVNALHGRSYGDLYWFALCDELNIDYKSEIIM